jgi:hypothetical protein
VLSYIFIYGLLAVFLWLFSWFQLRRSRIKDNARISEILQRRTD